MSNCTKIDKQLCLRLLNWVQGRSPCKKDDVILRRVRRPLGAEESRAAPIYKRGAVPVRGSLLCVTVKLKSNIGCLYYYKAK